MSVESDATSIESITKALYEGISFQASGRPDWQRLRPLFIDGARIIPPPAEPGEPARALDIDTFEAVVNEMLAAGHEMSHGLQEVEA